MSKNREAFTLAEILITLSIIGVIAAMVIPSLVQNINDAQLKTAWKKAYADLNQATIRLRNDNGGSVEGSFTDNNTMRDTFSKYLNYVKSCDPDTSLGVCWHSPNTYKWLKGSLRPDSNKSSLVLSNGNLIYFSGSTNCSSQIGTSEFYQCGNVTIDVNGFKGPNTVGKDIFYAYILETTIKPLGIPGDYPIAVKCIDPPNPGWDDPENYGRACSAKYLYQ